jgi:hypothetical protein
MSEMNYTIGVCGFGATGSSCVTDFLKEFDENIVLDDIEFFLPYFPDGIDDLAYHLHAGSLKFQSSIVAIERFQKLCKNNSMRFMKRATHGQFEKLTQNYLQKIIQLDWYCYCNIDNFLLYPIQKNILIGNIIKHFLLKSLSALEKIINREIHIYPLRERHFSINPENFTTITREYVNALLSSMGKQNGKNVVLDQPFAGNNPQKSFAYFDNPKAIVVDRDPRDLYLSVKKFSRYEGWRFTPTETVEKFVIYYKRLRENMPYTLPHKDILNIHLEDMIYEYDKTTKHIIMFLDLKEHSKPKSIFDPQISINNTHLIDRFHDCAHDIEYIEKKLPEYLYPFEKYQIKKSQNGKLFSNSSPLNNNNK